MGKKRTGFLAIHKRIVEVLERYPQGASIKDLIRELQHKPGEQTQLGRRVRQLNTWYHLGRGRREGEYRYCLGEERLVYLDVKNIDQTTRARILHRDGSQCQMCGKTSRDERVRLHVDHKSPRDWGGRTVDENLWTLCSECNQGKRNFFASITDPLLRKAFLHESIHIRLGELLKSFGGEPVPKEYLQFVAAGTHDDFERRLRDLRKLGWRFRPRRRKEDGRTNVHYVLEHWEPWPEDPAVIIKQAEAKRKARNKQNTSEGEFDLGGTAR